MLWGDVESLRWLLLVLQTGLVEPSLLGELLWREGARWCRCVERRAHRRQRGERIRSSSSRLAEAALRREAALQRSEGVSSRLAKAGRRLLLVYASSRHLTDRLDAGGISALP